jgi:hypothetical protein
MASRSKAMQVEKGWKGKNKVLRLQLPKRGVGGVGSVGGVGGWHLLTNATNASFEDSSEITATITREPSGTSLPTNDEWEEV